jgi:hypothetical protein
MPRYFFDTLDQEISFVDADGFEYADDAVAKAQAMRGLGDIVRELVYAGRVGKASVSVRRESGAVIFTMECTTASHDAG